MLFQKLARDRRKFKLSLSVHHVDFAQGNAYKDGEMLKVKIKRGDNHQLEIISDPVRKGQFKFSKKQREPKEIPLTLFYDQETDTYLEKELQVKVYVVSEFGETIRKLGKTVLDVSTDILPNGEHKFALEVSISIDNVDTCKVILYVQLLQVDDNSKSVATSEYPDVQDRLQQKTKDQRSSGHSGHKELRSEDPSTERVARRRQTKDILLKAETDSVSSRTAKQSFLSPKNNISVSPPTADELKSQKPKTVVETPLGNSIAVSPQLQQFVQKRKMQENQSEIYRLNKEVKSLRSVLDSMLEQKRKRELESASGATFKEMQRLKEQLVEREVRISFLQSDNKALKEREIANEKKIDFQKKQIAYFKGLAEKQKNKMARLMQRCLETTNEQLIDLVEEELTKEGEEF